MTKQDIIDKLARHSKIQKKEIQDIIENYHKIIIESVDAGEKVNIRGFGSLHRIIRKNRQVYSHFTGGKIDIPAKSVIIFKASKTTEKKL